MYPFCVCVLYSSDKTRTNALQTHSKKQNNNSHKKNNCLFFSDSYVTLKLVKVTYTSINRYDLDISYYHAELKRSHWILRDPRTLRVKIKLFNFVGNYTLNPKLLLSVIPPSTLVPTASKT